MKPRKILRYEITREEPFPRDIGRRINNLVSVARSEPHQITFLSTSDTPKTGTDLRRNVLDVTDGILDFHDANFNHYCNDVFVNNGVVREEHAHFDRGNPVLMWRRNHAGYVFAKPVCSFLLKKATEFGISISDFLNTPNGYFILEYVLQKSQRDKNIALREIDIADALRLHKSTVLEHLIRLRDLGIVSYESVGPEIRWSKYRIAEDRKIREVTPINEEVTLTRKVVEYIEGHTRIEHNRLFEELLQDPRYVSVGSENLRNRISKILGRLEDLGFIVYERYKGRERLSEVSLTYEGRIMIKDLSQIRRFLEGKIDISVKDWARYAKEAAEIYQMSGHSKVTPQHN